MADRAPVGGWLSGRSQVDPWPGGLLGLCFPAQAAVSVAPTVTGRCRSEGRERRILGR